MIQWEYSIEEPEETRRVVGGHAVLVTVSVTSISPATVTREQLLEDAKELAVAAEDGFELDSEVYGGLYGESYEELVEAMADMVEQLGVEVNS